MLLAAQVVCCSPAPAEQERCASSPWLRNEIMASRFFLSIFWGVLLATNSFPQAAADASKNSIITVTSKDGTRIVVECAGAGPSLVIVHGGTGDRSRWTPLFPLFASRFTVCAMDRRGHGASGDSPDYSLQK